VPEGKAIGFGTPSPGALDGGIVDFDFNWDFFQAHSTPNAFGLLPENSLPKGSFASKPPSHPSLSDVAQSPNPLGFSPTHHMPAAEQMDMGQDELPKPARVHLGASSEMDPFLRGFYNFDTSSRFQSSLRSSQSFGNWPATSTLFVETPRRVTDAIADNLSPSTAEDALIQDMELYRTKLFVLFERYIRPFYPVCQPMNNSSISPVLTAAMYGIALPWRSHDPTLPWAQFDTKGVTRQNAPEVQRIWQSVWRSISRELYAPSYDTIQAYLLLMEREKSKPFVSDGPFEWTLVTTTVSLAFTLGLHLNPDQWRMSEQEHSQRKLLWWIVYLQERWFAATMGHPVLIKEEDFDVPWPETMMEPGELEASSGTNNAYFLRLMRLTAILDEILRSFMQVICTLIPPQLCAYN
jgi:hypothetical protein